MKRNLFRAAGLALASTVVAGLLAATPAAALQTVNGVNMGPLLGQATLSPATGNVLVAPTAFAPVACPASAAAVDIFLDSTTAGITGAVITGADGSAATINTTGTKFLNTLVDTAALAGKTLVNGNYDVTIGCALPFGAGYAGHFDLSLTVSGGATPTVQGTTFTFNAPALPTTTTTLAVSPAGPVTQGASVTLTATVAATGATVAGTVQFKSGATNVGTPVAVSATGVATLVTTALPPGANQALTAVFTPATPATTQGSTSNTVTFTVNAPAQATTLTLANSPAAPTTADVVTVSANVASTTAVNVGRVTFTETTTPAPATVAPAQTVNVVGGVASAQFTGLSAGTHTFSASFSDPSVPQQFLPSGPVTITITVTTFAGASATETITTSVGAGTITLTAGGTVALGQLSLNATNSLLVAAPVDINTVTVTDTRAGAPGFTVSGQVTDFTGPGTSKINGDNLGWAPKVLTQAVAGGSIQAGPSVPAGNGLAVGAVAPAGTGLKTARVLATAGLGAGLGTSTYSATLSLNAPTSTTAGAYSATLTLTAL